MGNSNLENLSYAVINESQPKFKKMDAGNYTVAIGGLSDSIAELNKQSASKTQDSFVFAIIQRKPFPVNSTKIAWKIHLSIHPHDLSKGWDLICPLLDQHAIRYFKVARQEVSENKFEKIQHADTDIAPNKDRALIDLSRIYHGMQVTIYGYQEELTAYPELLTLIESTLSEAGIRPGVIHQSDRALGFYSSIRFAERDDDTYDKAPSYKPIEQEDPFQAVQPDWNRVRIPLMGLNFEAHIEKVRILVDDFVALKRQVQENKRTEDELRQAYFVAMEYLKHWRRFLQSHSRQDLENLSGKDQEQFKKWESWVKRAYAWIPDIMVNALSKTHKAEEALNATMRRPQVPKQLNGLLKRRNAKSHLKTPSGWIDMLEALLEPEIINEPAPTLPWDDSVDNEIVAMLENKEPEFTPEASSTLAAKILGGVLGACLGAGLAIILLPYSLLPLAILGVALGFAVGAVIGHVLAQLKVSEPKDPQKQASEELSVESVSEPKEPVHIKGLGLFAKENSSHPQPELDSQNQLKK